MDNQSAPPMIHKLVETFEQNLDSYRSTHKNETELRREFLDKFFTALGWDVANEKGYDEAGKQVVHEFSVEVAGAQKKADYAFRVGRGEKFDFLVEAKKPSVKVESSQEAAFQLRRYGWSAKLPINILTDFEHFAVYDCRAKPSIDDKASLGRIMLIHYKEYEKRWNEIAEIFSPEAVRKGSFAKYAEGTKGKKGTADVDDAFLEEIERWRDLLARNIALRNKAIDIAGLNYAVQMTIDRIVFLRICEERGIEPENQLLDLANKNGAYKELCALFKRADTKYNSGLFHFKNEKGQNSHPDDFTLVLELDDKVLKDIISNLYYPKSPYAFLYIPSDILGQVYERFLGKVIRLTAGHSAKVEEKPEVRKAGGVYYTPTYIVEYIVKNTIGTLVNKETSNGKAGVTPADVAKLKIVDPACGSGTFLLGAYQFLLDWHLNWYVEHDPEKWVKAKAIYPLRPLDTSPKSAGAETLKSNRSADLGEAGRGWSYRLTTAKKKEILLNNIHGVDIDSQAVEVTKLSLLLKVLENASGQLGLGMERVLPDLGNNIKCGNSLIGFDYFEGQLFPNDEERARVNPFDWKSEFKDVFANGGFDAVIGNPPYGAMFSDTEKEFLKASFIYKAGKPESYIFFIEKAISILKQNGLLGFIIPNAWLTNYYGQQLRQYILSVCQILQVVDLEPVKVFADAIVDTVILTIQKNTDVISNEQEISLSEGTPDGKIIYKHSIHQRSWRLDKESVFNIMTNNQELLIVEKMSLTSATLSEICEYSQGIIPYKTKEDGVKNLYISSTQKDASWKPLLDSGNSVGKFSLRWNGQYIHYGNWLWCQRDAKYFDEPKLLFHRIRKKLPIQLVATFDDTGFYNRHSLSNIILKANNQYSLKYILGLFNSKSLNFWFIKRFGLLMEVGGFKVGELPIRPIDFSIPAEKSQHDKMVNLVEQMLALHKALAAAQTPQEKERLERQIQVTDGAIDSLVYALYGLNEAEIRIVEGK